MDGAVARPAGRCSGACRARGPQPPRLPRARQRRGTVVLARRGRDLEAPEGRVSDRAGVRCEVRQALARPGRGDARPRSVRARQHQGARGVDAAGRDGPKRGKVIVTVTTAQGDTVIVDTGGPGRQGVNRYVWNLRYAGPTKLTFEKPREEEEENPFRQSGGPRAVPGTYRVAVTAGSRTETASVTVEPDPFIRAEPAAFQAQLQAGLEWRNTVSATHEMLNRIASLETQLKGVQQALRENLRGDTTATAPVNRQAGALGRKLKELKDSLYNSELQRDAGQDDIHYLTRFSDRLQSLGFGMALAYAQPPTAVVAARFQALRHELDGYLARFNELVRTDVAAFNKTALERQSPILVAGEPVAVKDVKIVSR